ncbi:MAG TPA: ORF6N domain-containing protein [Candidatus Acidoferrum sp.]|nr:ORF6N domain-containing protein [Candidatus Acidoferrum sp.]
MYMANEPAIAPLAEMDGKIHLIRGQRVMLDSDLAAVYGVTTAALNQALKRNLKRFPSDFTFRLCREEFTNLISQIVTSSSHGGRRKLPWAFTEHDAIMLAAVLNSARAIEMSVFIVRAFVQMREVLMSDHQLSAKLDELEKRVGGHDKVIAQLVAAVRQLIEAPEDKPKREIGFHIREQSPPYRISRKS